MHVLFQQHDNAAVTVRLCRTYASVLIDFSLTVKMAILIFISGRCSAILSAKEGKSGFIYNLVKS